MICPHCNNKKHIEIDIHSDGYAKGLFECSSCGTVWLVKSEEIITVSKAA